MTGSIMYLKMVAPLNFIVSGVIVSLLRDDMVWIGIGLIITGLIATVVFIEEVHSVMELAKAGAEHP